MESEAAFLRAVNVADYNAIVEYIAANDPSSLRNENGLTALHLATMNNSRHILQLMVEHQINLRPESVPEWLNARTADGRTCLHIAARQGYLNLSELLISFGADPHIRTEEGSSPIHYAALGNQPSLIAYLHEEIGLSAALCDYTGNTPLHYAAMEGSDLAVALLLMLARDQIDVGNAKGNRPLHLAAAGGQQRTTKLLMSQGADITVINSDLLTPRSLARQYYQESTAIALEQPAILSLCFKSGVPVLRPSFIPVSVFLVLTYYVAWVVALQWYWCCTAMLFVLYAIICCIDPGEVPQAPGAKLYPLYKSAKVKAVCPYCRIVRPSRAHHCSACNRCVRKYDHHCPWIRNCVGARNLGLFYAYISFLLVCLVLANGVLACRFDAELKRGTHQGDVDSPILRITSALFVTIVIGVSVGYLFCIITKNFYLGKTSFERFSFSHLDYLTEEEPGSKDLKSNFLQMCCDQRPSDLELPLLR